MLANKNISETLLNIARISAIIAVSAGTFSTALTSIACALMLASWIVSGRALSTLAISWRHDTGKLIIAFFLLLTVGVFYGNTNWQIGVSTLWSWRKLLYGFILLGLFYSPYWKRLFINSYISGMSIALGLSYLAWFEVIPSKEGAGVGILAKNYTIQGMAFIIAIICSITLLKDAGKLMQPVYGLMILAFTVNVLFLNPGRSGYLALIAGGLVAALNSFGRKKIPHIIVITLATVLTATLASETLQGRIRLGLGEAVNYQHSEQLTSIGIRMVFVENTLELVAKKPVFGYGTGSFGTEYSKHVAPKYSDWRATPSTDPHNQYLYVLLENGIVGLLFFIALIAVTFRCAFRSGSYGIIAAGILTAWTITSFFNSHFKTFHEGHLLGLFLGALLAEDKANNHSVIPANYG